MLTNFGFVVSGMIGFGIILIGARFLLAPLTAAAGYGLSADPSGSPSRRAVPTLGSM